MCLWTTFMQSSVWPTTLDSRHMQNTLELNCLKIRKDEWWEQRKAVNLSPYVPGPDWSPERKGQTWMARGGGQNCIDPLTGFGWFGLAAKPSSVPMCYPHDALRKAPLCPSTKKLPWIWIMVLVPLLAPTQKSRGTEYCTQATVVSLHPSFCSLADTCLVGPCRYPQKYFCSRQQLQCSKSLMAEGNRLNPVYVQTVETVYMPSYVQPVF